MSSTKADHCLADETGPQIVCVSLKKPKKREELLAAQADGLCSPGAPLHGAGACPCPGTGTGGVAGSTGRCSDLSYLLVLSGGATILGVHLNTSSSEVH